MARAHVVEVAARADGAGRGAPSRKVPAQAGRALVSFARYGDEGAAAWAGDDHMTVDDAYAYCRAIAHKHGANFSVGFRFLPRLKRRVVYAARSEEHTSELQSHSFISYAV